MKKLIIPGLLILLIGISLFVRVVGLEKSPLSLGFDEASLGYNAYSLYLTGKDEYGNPLPLSLRSFNDFKPALYAYLAIPFIHFLDLNQTAVRAPSALMGTISLLFMLLIFKRLSKQSWIISILIIMFLSFLPWRLHFSRVAFESNVSMAFFTGAVWCLLNYERNRLYKIFLIIFSTLAIYSYHGARLAIPILLVFYLTDKNRKSLKKPKISILKSFWPLLAIFSLYIPMFLETRAGNILTRFSQTNVFTHFYPYSPSELTVFSNPLFNILGNPIYFLGGILSGHVFSYLSPQNLSLLIYPGVIKSAQVISGSGMFGYIGGLFFVLGLGLSLNKLVKDREWRILGYWFLSGIAPAALTWEWFYPLRSLNAFPSMEIVIGMGIVFVIHKLWGLKNAPFKYFLVGALTATLVMSSIYNTLNELNYGAWETNGEFQPGGYKEGAPLLSSLMDKYDTIYIDSAHAQNYTIFWFYLKYPPEKVQQIAGLRNRPGVEGPPTFDFDKFKYRKYDWPTVKKENSFVFWTSSEVKDDEILSTPGAKLYRINSPLDNWPVTIITKD
jgi:hypothetical protein